MTTAGILISGAFLFNMTVFAFAIRMHFARPEGTPVATKWILGLGYPLAAMNVAGHAFSAPPALWRWLPGLMLCGIGLALFHAALASNRARPLSLAGSEDVPLHLNLRGPYGRIRHPFYASYLATWVGSAIAGPWWLWAAPVIMGVIYFGQALREEEKFLSSPLSAEYRDYMRHTGRFLPKLFCGKAKP